LHFEKHILPALGHVPLAALGSKELSALQLELIGQGLSVKYARNILNGSLRAMFRDARTEIEELQGKDPWTALTWPDVILDLPDPFTAEERDAILDWWFKNDLFYYPYVYWQFHTGMRPSETHALTWRDIDFAAETVNVVKSRDMGATAPTKKPKHRRRIKIDSALVDILKLLPSRELGLEHVFVNKRGEPLSSGWADDNWKQPLKELSIRYRKFYACRHTAITELVKAGHNIKAIADFVGTSVSKIENNYCARQGLEKTQNRHTGGANYQETLVTGSGVPPDRIMAISLFGSKPTLRAANWLAIKDAPLRSELPMMPFFSCAPSLIFLPLMSQ